jgi:hypothetical protein
VSELTPTRCPIRTTAAFCDSSGSCSRAACTSLIARSRNSCGYFLGAGTVIILSGIRTLHQCRGDSDSRNDTLRALKRYIARETFAITRDALRTEGGLTNVA